MLNRIAHLSVLLLLAGCKAKSPTATPVDGATVGDPAEQPATVDDFADVGPRTDKFTAPPSCGGQPLRVTFYDAGQALAALVTLPDGTHILVDSGENPRRPGCGAACKAWHERVVQGVTADVEDGKIELVWITHQHSDHHGGLRGIGEQLELLAYADNGQQPAKNGVVAARKAARDDGATLVEIGPGKTDIPLSATDDVTVSAVVPNEWPTNCEKHPNDCSIGLLVDYCDSEILFTGDAEAKAEAAWDVGDIDLLQVGHHGSDTSTSEPFVQKVKPNYAVISTTKRGEATNRTYCHPRKSTIDRLVQATGSSGGSTVPAFDAAVSCRKGGDDNWPDVPTGDRVWVTGRDGTVVLETTGDGSFSRVEAGTRYMSDAEIREMMVRGSVASHPGKCACPDDTMSNGRRCGGRSAYSRGGGDAPICYPSEVSDEDVVEYRRR